MNRVTNVVLRVKWNDEQEDHPAGWDWPSLCAKNPFEKQSLRSRVDFLSFEDMNAEGRVDQT